jgi:hypothetical protein
MLALRGRSRIVDIDADCTKRAIALLFQALPGYWAIALMRYEEGKRLPRVFLELAYHAVQLRKFS